MDGLIQRYLLIILIRVFDGAVFYTDGTTRAFVLQDIPWFFNQRDVKIPCLPLYAVNLGIREDLYVGMPADLDQLRCEYSHGAVIGWEGLIKLRHMATNAGRLLNQVHLKTSRSKIKRGLNTADPPANNHDISKITVSKTSPKLFDIVSDRYYIFHGFSPHQI
jgi:hypothetical protein